MSLKREKCILLSKCCQHSFFPVPQNPSLWYISVQEEDFGAGCLRIPNLTITPITIRLDNKSLNISLFFFFVGEQQHCIAKGNRNLMRYEIKWKKENKLIFTHTTHKNISLLLTMAVELALETRKCVQYMYDHQMPQRHFHIEKQVQCASTLV